MIKLKYILISVIFTLSYNACGQNFELLDTDITGTTDPLSEIVVLNDSTVVAVGGSGWGSGGVIIRTTNYGQTWSLTPVLDRLTRVKFVTDSIGYAVGASTIIMKTTDAGDNWVYQNTSVVTPTHYGASIAFFNVDSGFVGLKNGPGYAFLRTQDGGETWVNHLVDTVQMRTELQTINDSTMYGVSIGVSQTTDYGNSWSLATWPLMEWGGETYGAHFFNKDTGLVAIRYPSLDCWSPFYIARTEDGGENWEAEYYECEYFTSFEFPNENIGFAIGNFANDIRYLWRTQNAGVDWTKTAYPVGEQYEDVSCMGTSIACVDSDTCYICTNYGTIIKMTNASDGIVGVQQEILQNDIELFPNPSTDIVQIRSSKSIVDGQVSVYNLSGKCLFSQEIEKIDQISIDVSHLSPGIYVLQVMNGNETLGTEKLVVQ